MPQLVLLRIHFCDVSSGPLLAFPFFPLAFRWPIPPFPLALCWPFQLFYFLGGVSIYPETKREGATKRSSVVVPIRDGTYRNSFEQQSEVGDVGSGAVFGISKESSGTKLDLESSEPLLTLECSLEHSSDRATVKGPTLCVEMITSSSLALQPY